ncbi:LAP2 protein, partial [Amia calva]|nr:LAP2 protein [Amia calva]
MPVFVDDPNRLSKERLRSELVAHNVPLPPGETRKRVFVDLYLKHVAHRTAADFSSDEEDQAPEDGRLEEEDDEGDSEVMDVHQLTDEELKAELIKYGVKPGPILATTRQLYEKKLQRLLHPSDGQKAPPDEEHYSDSEEDETVLSLHVRCTGEAVSHLAVSALSLPPSLCCPLTVSALSLQGPAEDDVLQEMFPNEVRTPTGISATRRRPIKGAAGRPVQFKYSDLVPLASSGGLDSLGLSRRLVPIWAQVLVFLLLAGFLFVLYCAMEANSDNPFTEYIDNASTGSEVMQEPPPAMDAQLPLTRQE